MFVRKRGVSASSGTGMLISTLLAVLRRLNCALAWGNGQPTACCSMPYGHTLSMYSILLPLWLSTTHSTHISGFTCVFSR